MDVVIHKETPIDGVNTYSETKNVGHMKISFGENDYVRITCKDGSHMLLNDVKVISCFKVGEETKYEENN